MASPETNIKRPYYSNWLNRWQDKKVIKVVTGMRRSGKSTILQMFRESIAVSQPSATIITINFESMDADYPTDAKGLYSYVERQLQPGRNYVFLDEVQHVDHFEKAVDALYVRPDIDLYITGSNAYLLSSELSTLLTGRYVELTMHPLSFAEYRSTRSAEEPVDQSFNRYLTYGGLPYTVFLDDDQSIADYLSGVFNTILVRDIAVRTPTMNVAAFMEVTSFLADNIGNITSANGIAKAMSQSHRISQNTVREYIAELQRNFLLWRADRYDIKGKEYLRTLEKYYLGDLGFRFWMLGKDGDDVGHRIENVVYLELKRRYRTVNIGKVGSAEVDFVAQRNGEKHYFQVSQTVLDERTRARELAPFNNIDDHHPKTLLTLDRIGTGNYEGVAHLNVLDWLLDVEGTESEL